MNTFKKLLCMGLAATFILSALASCANNEDEPENPAESGTVGTDVNEVIEFEEADFKKAEFRILHYGDKATDFHDEYIDAEAISGSTIGDAVYERNSLAEEKYNVTVVGEERDSPMTEATKRMQSGQCDYDLIYEWGIRSKANALDGLLMDFYEMEDYLHLDQSWWVPSAVEGLTVADRMFVATNMVTMNSLSWASIMYFNKMLMDKHNFTYPYSYVYTDNWTYDVIIPMALAAEIDVDGDGEMGFNDEYSGLSGSSVLSAVCDDTFIEENDDGSYTVIPYTERMVAQYDKYSDTLKTIKELDSWGLANETGYDNFPSIYVAMRFLSFGSDREMFMGGSLDMTKEFVEMKSDYGVVPDPVVEPGDEFACGIDYCAPMFSMPIQLEDPEMAAIVLDYLAYESERILLPAYYETTIKTKRMQDTRDYDMLDIVRGNIGYNWRGVYMWDSTLANLRSEMLISGSFSSIAKRMEAKCQAEIDEIVDQIAAIGLE